MIFRVWWILIVCGVGNDLFLTNRLESDLLLVSLPTLAFLFFYAQCLYWCEVFWCIIMGTVKRTFWKELGTWWKELDRQQGSDNTNLHIIVEVMNLFSYIYMVPLCWAPDPGVSDDVP